MTRIQLAFLAVIPLIALVTSCSSNKYCRKHFFTKEDYEDIREGISFLMDVEKIKVGMSFDEVKVLMGKPLGFVGCGLDEGTLAIWRSSDKKHVVHVHIQSYTVDAILWKDRRPDGTWVPEGIWVPEPDGTWVDAGAK